MRRVASALGIIAGTAGLVNEVRLIVRDWESLAGIPREYLAAGVIMGVIAFALILLGLAGGLLVGRRPVLGGCFMLVSGGIGIAILPGYVIMGPILIVGAVLAFLSLLRRQEPAAKAKT